MKTINHMILACNLKLHFEKDAIISIFSQAYDPVWLL